ncbi:MAG: murein biosynthesis integral membrane protein MurJ [Firmicutes bacterium]|nr:murein biosynthesis integral membrane protein MurJ [Bacillota bacterium]
MRKTVFILILITIISKICGFVRDIVLANFYGASNVSDVYLIATTIPMVIFAFIGKGIATSFIPTYAEIEANEGEKEADIFTNKLSTLLLIISSALILFGLVFTKQLVLAFASGFDEETLKLGINFTRITLLGIYFTVFVHLYSAFLQFKDRFIAPAIIGFPMNIIIIISIWLGIKYSDYILPVGSVIAIIIQVLFLLPSLFNKDLNFKFHLNFRFNDKYIKKIIILAMPVILGVAVNEINVLVDRTLASRIIVGGISALNYSNKLNIFIQSIFVISISTVIYPKISSIINKRNTRGLKNIISNSIDGVSLIVIPATVGIIVFSEEIITVLFARGAFDKEAIELTSSALFFYSFGMLGNGLREILSRVFYSLQDTKTPMINASIGLVINIVLNIILSRYLGIGGLALATSISSSVIMILMLISLERKIGSLGFMKNLISIIKILVISLLMGLISKYIFIVMSIRINSTIALILSVLAGILIYGVMIYFARINSVDEIFMLIRNRIVKKNDSDLL